MRARSEEEARASAEQRRPRGDEIDVYGLTHRGKVRPTNQDHFLICRLRQQVAVQYTSLPDPERFARARGRTAFLAMVADGVGGSAAGEEASRYAVEAITEFVLESMRCYYTSDPADDATFAKALEEAALRCHLSLVERTKGNPALEGTATTLTLWLGLWPRGYLLQVGDSRCYVLRERELIQISRDQTMAQALVDQGVMSRTDALNTPWAHVLSSSIGGPQSAPVVMALYPAWGQVGLLCSDGLTKHVPDDRIRERLIGMTSARQACEALLQDALDGGGSDNITVVIARAVPKA